MKDRHESAGRVRGWVLCSHADWPFSHFRKCGSTLTGANFVFREAAASRQRERLKVQRAAFSPAHHEGMLWVEAIELFDTRPAFNRLVRQTLLVRNRRRDALRTFHLIRADLHDASATVGQQEVIL